MPKIIFTVLISLICLDSSAFPKGNLRKNKLASTQGPYRNLSADAPMAGQEISGRDILYVQVKNQQLVVATETEVMRTSDLVTWEKKSTGYYLESYARSRDQIYAIFFDPNDRRHYELLVSADGWDFRKLLDIHSDASYHVPKLQVTADQVCIAVDHQINQPFYDATLFKCSTDDFKSFIETDVVRTDDYDSADCEMLEQSVRLCRSYKLRKNQLVFPNGSKKDVDYKYEFIWQGRNNRIFVKMDDNQEGSVLLFTDDYFKTLNRVKFEHKIDLYGNNGYPKSVDGQIVLGDRGNFVVSDDNGTYFYSPPLSWHILGATYYGRFNGNYIRGVIVKCLHDPDHWKVANGVEIYRQQPDGNENYDVNYTIAVSSCF